MKKESNTVKSKGHTRKAEKQPESYPEDQESGPEDPQSAPRNSGEFNQEEPQSEDDVPRNTRKNVPGAEPRPRKQEVRNESSFDETIEQGIDENMGPPPKSSSKEKVTIALKIHKHHHTHGIRPGDYVETPELLAIVEKIKMQQQAAIESPEGPIVFDDQQDKEYDNPQTKQTKYSEQTGGDEPNMEAEGSQEPQSNFNGSDEEGRSQNEPQSDAEEETPRPSESKLKKAPNRANAIAKPKARKEEAGTSSDNSDHGEVIPRESSRNQLSSDTGENSEPEQDGNEGHNNGNKSLSRKKVSKKTPPSDRKKARKVEARDPSSDEYSDYPPEKSSPLRSTSAQYSDQDEKVPSPRSRPKKISENHSSRPSQKSRHDSSYDEKEYDSIEENQPTRRRNSGKLRQQGNNDLSNYHSGSGESEYHNRLDSDQESDMRRKKKTNTKPPSESSRSNRYSQSYSDSADEISRNNRRRDERSSHDELEESEEDKKPAKNENYNEKQRRKVSHDEQEYDSSAQNKSHTAHKDETGSRPHPLQTEMAEKRSHYHPRNVETGPGNGGLQKISTQNGDHDIKNLREEQSGRQANKEIPGGLRPAMPVDNSSSHQNHSQVPLPVDMHTSSNQVDEQGRPSMAMGADHRMHHIHYHHKDGTVTGADLNPPPERHQRYPVTAQPYAQPALPPQEYRNYDQNAPKYPIDQNPQYSHAERPGEPSSNYHPHHQHRAEYSANPPPPQGYGPPGTPVYYAPRQQQGWSGGHDPNTGYPMYNDGGRPPGKPGIMKKIISNLF